MRETKFRYLSRHTGKMVYSDKYNEFKNFWDDEAIDCVPGTTGQYTGLKDAKEKEIYEGDVVKHDYEEDPQTVTWAEEFVTYRLMPSEIFPIDVDVKGKKMKVIGSIYENPTLLEG